MARLPRFSFPLQWRKALRPDGRLAEAEGLAAGTGMLTGDVLRNRPASAAPCPTCSGRGEVVVIDLLSAVVSRRCQSCGNRWDEPSAAGVAHSR